MSGSAEPSLLEPKHVAVRSGVHRPLASKLCSELPEHGASVLLFALLQDGGEGLHTRWSVTGRLEG